MPKCIGLYGTPEKVAADVHLLFLMEDDDLLRKGLDKLPPKARESVQALKAKGDFTGGDKQILHVMLGPDSYVLAGLGARGTVTTDKLRRAAGRAMKSCSKRVVDVVALHSPAEEVFRKVMHCSFEEMIQAMLEGAMMGMYRYEKYVSRKDAVVRGVVKEYRVVVSDEGYQSRLKAIVDYTALLVDGTELARNMTNAPANELSPDVFAKEAAALAAKHGYKCSVLGRKELETHKMAGMLAVSGGSKRDPRFITLEYNETKRKLPSFVLVGKGITFDSGGLSIKPASAMEDMKTDMAGAAAVLATMDVCARLKLPVRLIGLIPLTDNVIGGNAMCPGDIIRYSNGKSVEVLNTDAEGRLILADALIYAHRYKPNCIIDIATLTGAIMVALGTAATGMMGTDDAVKSALKTAGEKTRERVWEMPLYEDYDHMIKGTITDLKNQSGRWGGALTAGAFLKAFAGELPWVHLDIAGTATLDDPVDYAPKGATGVGVRLLVEFMKNLKPPA